MVAGDLDAARDLRDAPFGSATEPCDTSVATDPSFRLVSHGVTRTDSGATVSVTLSGSDQPGPLGPIGGDQTDVFTLTRRDGRWSVTSVPWRLELCRPWEAGP